MRATPFFFFFPQEAVTSPAPTSSFTPSSFHHAMDDMPSDGAVAVGPHRSDGMGNELQTGCGAGARVGGMKLRGEMRRE